MSETKHLDTECEEAREGLLQASSGNASSSELDSSLANDHTQQEMSGNHGYEQGEESRAKIDRIAGNVVVVSSTLLAR